MNIHHVKRDSLARRVDCQSTKLLESGMMFAAEDGFCLRTLLPSVLVGLSRERCNFSFNIKER